MFCVFGEGTNLFFIDRNTLCCKSEIEKTKGATRMDWGIDKKSHKLIVAYANESFKGAYQYTNLKERENPRFSQEPLRIYGTGIIPSPTDFNYLSSEDIRGFLASCGIHLNKMKSINDFLKSIRKVHVIFADLAHANPVVTA